MSAEEILVQKDQLVVTVVDDDGVGRAIEDFIKLSNENLKSLCEQKARYDGEILKAVTAEAQRRKTAFEEQDKRDAKLPFKVNRG